ncbi:RNA polymerase II mediator complex subunit [Elasticomyces elasticus]|uniref:Mediator of RNA polymerase II transcription subunit 17 n=1 Tax=Elasticomyces elasticus TaxID=574655 RepID=A0AAN7VQC1_9PEZI|nr:RNA polymerase II mediator complex subunit [Elasticomyces elasticus]
MASLTFRPWTRDAPEAGSLKDVLSRVAADRGHFRELTEAALQEEIAGEGALESSDSDEDDENVDREDSQASAKPATRDDLFKARAEMLQHIDTANNEVMIALDFVSLLLTKDAPEKGKTTISAEIKRQIPLGSLGYDMWQNMPVNKAREAQDALLATNVRMESLQRSADSLLVAADRLESNVRKETQYWDQILSITANGWNVCKLPGQQHRLGVTYGFNESAPEFSRRGIAALNASPDGGILLERGIGSKPKAMRVILKQGGLDVGRSRVPTVADESETMLEARIRHARNSLFDEELYHELLRESRGQASLGVSTTSDGIVFRSTSAESPQSMEVLLELVGLDDIQDDLDVKLEQDTLAQVIALVARTLLSQAHREKVKKRSAVPPPLSERRDDRPTLPILRPVMAFLLQQTAMKLVHQYTSSIGTLLAAAHIDHEDQLAAFDLSKAADIHGVEDLASILMQRWTSESVLSFYETKITIRLETTLAQSFGTLYTHIGTNGRVDKFTECEELRTSCDAAIASELALYLQRKAGQAWKCNVREALVTKHDSKGGKEGRIRVTVDSQAGLLALNSPTKKISWGSQSSSSNTFNDAWLELLG